MLFMQARFFVASEDVIFIQWKGSCMQRLNTKSGGQIIALQMIRVGMDTQNSSR
jgi:hypothetical protein